MPKVKTVLASKATYFLLLLFVLFATRQAIIWFDSRPPNHVHIYDLDWSDKDGNEICYHKWRYYLKPNSFEPFKIEKYSKTTSDPSIPYNLIETLIINYPSDEEMKEIIRSVTGKTL